MSNVIDLESFKRTSVKYREMEIKNLTENLTKTEICLIFFMPFILNSFFAEKIRNKHTKYNRISMTLVDHIDAVLVLSYFFQIAGLDLYFTYFG